MIIIMINPREIARAMLPFVLALTLIAGLYPDGGLPGDYNFNKVAQIGAFGVLAFLCSAGFGHRRRFLQVVVLCLLAACLENLQGYVPGRTATLDDALSGCAGVMLGCLGWHFVERVLGLRQSKMQN